MQAVYNFHWDSSYSPSGVGVYYLNVNGSMYTSYGNNMEISLPENTSIHAEIYAVDNAGQSSDVAAFDFTTATYTVEPTRPTMPGNFGADFVRWE
jgi:hypothetical protein